MHVHDHLPLDELRRLADTITRKRIWIRYRAVVLALQGYTAARIAQALGCTPRAVQAWIARYNRGGPDALDERPHTGRPPRLGESMWPRFQQRLEAGPQPHDRVCTFRGRDLQYILEHEFGVLMSLQGVYDLLHRHGFSSLMPRPQHKDSDEELQAIFKEVAAEQIRAIGQAHPEQEVRVYFEDEARLGQKGTLTRVWARTGSRPRGVQQIGYASLYVLTAVCASTGAATGLISPVLNAEVINLFLEQFAGELPEGVYAVLIWDGAGYHTSEGLKVPSNVSLIQLPPYSPELNPVENLWHYLRSHYWSLRVYRSYEELEDAAVEAWREVCLRPELISSICAAPYVNDCA